MNLEEHYSTPNMGEVSVGETKKTSAYWPIFKLASKTDPKTVKKKTAPTKVAEPPTDIFAVGPGPGTAAKRKETVEEILISKRAKKDDLVVPHVYYIPNKRMNYLRRKKVALKVILVTAMKVAILLMRVTVIPMRVVAVGTAIKVVVVVVLPMRVAVVPRRGGVVKTIKEVVVFLPMRVTVVKTIKVVVVFLPMRVTVVPKRVGIGRAVTLSQNDGVRYFIHLTSKESASEEEAQSKEKAPSKEIDVLVTSVKKRKRPDVIQTNR